MSAPKPPPQKADSSNRKEGENRENRGEGGSSRWDGKHRRMPHGRVEDDKGSIAVSTGFNPAEERIDEFQTLSTEMTKPGAQSHTKYGGEEVCV